MAGARHIICISRKEAWDPLYHCLVTDAPRAMDMSAEIRNKQARLLQTGTVGTKPGPYDIDLVAEDPSGNRSEPVALTVVRE